MKKLKSISATEALRLMRLGFSNLEIIQADQEVSVSSETKVESEKKKERKKEREKPKPKPVQEEEDLTSKEILKKLDEIKDKHKKAMEMAMDFAFENKKISEKNKNIFEEIKEKSKKEAESSGQVKNKPEEEENDILGGDIEPEF